MIGHCNICSAYGKLTRDHVPPKGSVKISQMLSLSLIHSLGLDSPKKAKIKGRLSQNGIKFPTLCGSCNNKLLGTELDPFLNEFVGKALTSIKQSTPAHSHIPISCNPHKTSRAFLGHITAASDYKASEFLRNQLGGYIRGVENMPAEAKIYCWPFPYKNQSIALFNAIAPGITKRGFDGVITTWSLKFAPVAFMLTWNQPWKFRLRNLTLLCDPATSDRDGEYIVDLKLSQVPQYWPEDPEPGDIVLSSTKNPGLNSFPYKNDRIR